jgi:hypothetical protein
MRNLFLVFAAAMVAVAVGMAGAQTADSAPLSMTYRVEDRTTPAQVVLDLQNVAGKPVAAYAIRLVRRGEDGKVISTRAHSVSTRGLGLSLGRASFQPGEKWSETITAPEGQPLEAQLDLVVFEDGSHWGPNKARQLERFQGLRDGARLEREAAKRQ